MPELLSSDKERLSEKDLKENQRALWLKSIAAMERLNYSYVISLLRPLLKEQPYFLEGRKFLRRAEIKQKELSKKRLSFGGSSLSLMKVQGQIKKDPALAIETIESTLESDPFSLQANQLLYDAAMHAGMTETAAFALETLREGHPNNTKSMHQLAEHYMDQDLPEKAADVYNEIVKRDSADLAALKGAKDATARASMQKQKWENASFRDLIKDKDEAASLEQRNRTQLTTDQAKQQLEQWLEKYAEDQNNINTVKRIGDLYERIEDWDNALTFYQWAHHLSKGDSSLERKVTLLNDKIEEQKMELLSNEIQSNPDAPDVEEKKAHYENLQQERLKKHIEAAQARVERNPTDPQLRFDLGQHLMEGGHYKEAIAELQRAKNNPHIRTHAMLLLGKCYEKRSMDDLAIRQLEEACKELQVMDGTKKDLVYTLGLVYEKTGNTQRYLDCMKEIYEIDYGYHDVAQRVESSYE